MKPERDKWDFYKGDDGDWYWRLTDRNGEVIGRSHEGYRRRTDCETNAVRHGWTKTEGTDENA